MAATGIAHVPGQPKDVAYLSCFFDSNLIAHFHVNWLAPVKIRRTLIGGSKQMIVYDDLEPSEKVKIYNKGITLSNGPEGIYQLLVDYRTGDMWAPQLDTDRSAASRSAALPGMYQSGSKAADRWPCRAAGGTDLGSSESLLGAARPAAGTELGCRVKIGSSGLYG